MEYIKAIFGNYNLILDNLELIIVAIIAICTVIPGVNTHLNVLQKIVDILKKINIGKKE